MKGLLSALAAAALGCGCLVAQNPSAGGDDPNEIDSQPMVVFANTVRDLLNREKFAELENIAATVRSSRSRFAGGAWKLNAFYNTVQGPGYLTAADAVWTAHIARLNRWVAAYPASPTPRIALAQAYLRYSWKARGHGYAKTVTENGWQLFNSRTKQAQSVLEAAASLSPKDPQWFRLMQEVALAQSWPREQENQLVESAMAIEPGYFYLYVAQANYLSTRWFGKEGEAEAFADSIADRIGGDNGSFVYYRIAEAMDCCGKKDLLPALSWDRIKQGFSAIENLYGSLNYQRNVMAYLALRHGDREFASQMFSRIGDDWSASVWRTKANFDGRIVEDAEAPATTK